MALTKKIYVPYGINGLFYVYDNEEGYIPPGYGSRYGTKKQIQKICDELNLKAQTLLNTNTKKPKQ